MRKKKYVIIITILLISTCIIIIFRLYSPIHQNTIFPTQEKVENIELDIDKTIDTYDFSSLVDSVVSIVPFENSAQCIIGEISDILLYQDKILVIDNVTKTVFIFDLQGNLLSKISNIGRGPNEYLGITACAVIDTTVIIYDHVTNKLNRYSFQGEFLEKIPFTGWATAMFTLGEKLYFINNWSSSSEGSFRLFSSNIKDQKLEKYLSFSQKTKRGWVLDRYHTQYKDTTFIFYSSCDTIFRITQEEVIPNYYVDFVKKKLPNQLATGDGHEALNASIQSDYITGIKTLNVSDHLFFIQYEDNIDSYISIYDKNSKNIITCHSMVFGQNGNISLFKFKIDQNTILSYCSAQEFKQLYQYVYSKAPYSNTKFKQEIENLNQSLKDDSNPILFIYKIKPSTHI